MMRDLPVAVRGFMVGPSDSKEPPKFYGTKRNKYPPYHSRVLVFDTETTIDEYQNFLFGQAWLVFNEKGNRVEKSFDAPTTHIQRYFIVADDFSSVYHGQNPTDEAWRVMQQYLNDHASEYVPCPSSINTLSHVWPKSVFVSQVLLPELVLHQTTLVGFNLPFDISRIATDCNVTEAQESFRFHLLPDEPQGAYPSITIKALDSKKAFIGLAYPYNVVDDYKKEHHRGRFLDLRTAIFALTNRATSLKYATTVLYPVANPKTMEDDAEHGTITESYLKYNTADLQATWELYCKVMEDYQSRHSVLATNTEIERLYSPASIGKAYFKAMGISPFMEKNSDFSQEILGYVMSSFYAGRSEVGIRNFPIQTFHVDVHSMYPSVFVLTKLWQHVIAESISTTNSDNPRFSKTQAYEKLSHTIAGLESLNLPVSEETKQQLKQLGEELDALSDSLDETDAMRVWMEAVDLETLLQPQTWQHLVGIVKVRPDHDLLPVRAKYGQSWNIGWNYLTSDVPLWYTMADVLAAKILTGKLPRIEQVVRFYPEKPEKALKSLDMQGLGITGKGPFGRFSPTKEDFFKTVIEARTRVKAERDQYEKGTADYQRLDGQQEGLKILANATSYGINVELNQEDCEPTDFNVFSLESSQGEFEDFEKPGPFFNPIVATTITGAAHLMLAVIQKLTEQYGGDYALMDTDSSFIVDRTDIGKPLREQQGNPKAIGQKVMDALRTLYPYDDNPERDLLEMEKDSRDHDPLYIYAVSAKRYATFVLDSNGHPAIVEGKTHGLAYAKPKNLMEGERWETMIWRQLIAHALGQKFQDNLPAWVDDAVTMRVGVTTPFLYHQIQRFRHGNEYRTRIKPWNFFTLAIGIGDMLEDQKAIRGWQEYFWHEYQATQQDSLFARVKNVTGGKMIRSPSSGSSEGHTPHDLAGEFRTIPKAFLRKQGRAIDEVADHLGMEVSDLLSALKSYRHETKKQKDFLVDAENQVGRLLPMKNNTRINRYYCRTYHVIATGTCQNKSLCDYADSCLANRIVKPISMDGGSTWQEMTTGEAVLLDTVTDREDLEGILIPIVTDGRKSFSVKTYAAILATHDKHPERKYDAGNGEPCTSSTQGRLVPTHVTPNKIEVIGKETGSMLEVTTHTGMLGDLLDAERDQTLMVLATSKTVPESTTIQGYASDYWDALRSKVKQAIKRPTAKQKARGMQEVSLRQLAKAIGINPGLLSRFLAGDRVLHPDNRVKVETWIQEHGGLGVEGMKTAFKDFGPLAATITDQRGTVFTALGKIRPAFLERAKAAFPDAFFTLYDVEYVRMSEALESWIDEHTTETLPERIAPVLQELEFGLRVLKEKAWVRIPYATIERVYLRMGGNGKYKRKSRVLVTYGGQHFEFVKKENKVFEDLGFIPTWKQCADALCQNHHVPRLEEVPSYMKPPYKFIGKEMEMETLISGVSREALVNNMGIPKEKLTKARYQPKEVLQLLESLN